MGMLRICTAFAVTASANFLFLLHLEPQAPSFRVFFGNTWASPCLSGTSLSWHIYTYKHGRLGIFCLYQ